MPWSIPRLLPVLALLASLVSCAPAAAARCVRGPYLQNPAAGSVEIRWELDRAGASAVEFFTGGETEQRAHSPFSGRKHRAKLAGLRAGERYRYRILVGSERATELYEFRAAPRADQAFTFAVFGDFGQGTPGQMAMARQLEKSPAEFALLTGDLIYGRGEEEHYDARFFAPYRKSLRRMNFWPALGNHDVGTKDGAAVLAIFDVPANGPVGVQTGRHYSFDYGNAHIVALDSNASPQLLRSTIIPWLERDLVASRQPWKFVFFHHPPFSSAGHGENAKTRDLLVPVFARQKVDIVFGGHDHAYERIKPRDGVLYIVSGNGGARLYEHKNPHAYTDFFYNKKHGFTEVKVDGSRLTLRHVNADGEQVDRTVIEKGSRLTDR